MRRLNAFLSRKEKEGRRDKEKEKEAAVQPKAPAAAPPVPAKPAVGSVTAAGDGSPAPRQVAFASEVERRSAPLEFYDEAPATSADAAGPSVNIDDAQSVLSHHGGPSHGLACFPVRGASPQTGSPIPVPSQPLQRRSSLNNPHPRSEGLTVGHGAAATLRAPRLSATSPIRGDIPRFSDPNERSATSLSQHTTASTSSSSFGSHSHGPGFYSGTTSPSSTAYYPNLAILATYARDINNAQQDRGTSTGMAQHLTWSEITDGELVENLGERERTRQEVLFEMVCSEERYVQELLVSGQLASKIPAASYVTVLSSVLAVTQGELPRPATAEASCRQCGCTLARQYANSQIIDITCGVTRRHRQDDGIAGAPPATSARTRAKQHARTASADFAFFASRVR